MPTLAGLMADIAARKVRVLETETATPSPFAASLLFGYVGAFMYEGDSPLAERRAAALSLDATLLAELLGRVELRELLDPEVVAATGRQLQHLSADRMARDAEAVADLLRLLGPLTTEEVAARAGGADVGGWLEGLLAAKRALTVSFAGQSWWVAIEDIGRLRDGVGVAVPVGVPASFTEAVTDPLGELLGRYARTHAPFTTADVAARFGLGLRVAADVLGRLAADGRLVRGEFSAEAAGDQWCDADVLRILRRRSLAALRAQVEPVSTSAYARFLPGWHQVGSADQLRARRAGGRRRSAGRRPAARLGDRIPRAAPAGTRLLPRHARRTAGFRRGRLVWRRIHLGRRRLGRVPPGRHGAVDPGCPRHDRADRGPPRDPGHPGRRRGLLLPAARADRHRRARAQSGTVGTHLGRSRSPATHSRRFARCSAAARAAADGPPRRTGRAAEHARPAEPLQRRARPVPRQRPHGGGPLVSAARCPNRTQRCGRTTRPSCC